MNEKRGWFKSTASALSNNCVEVCVLPSGGVAVRDSKDRTGPVLRFTRGEWDAFVTGARSGEFSWK